MQLKDGLTTQILALTLAEKAEVIQLLTQTSSNGINKTPGVCGGDACVGNTRIPVWLILSLRRQGAKDVEILQLYPQLSAADLVNSWIYGEAYSEEIETALKEQNEAMECEI